MPCLLALACSEPPSPATPGPDVAALAVADAVTPTPDSGDSFQTVERYFEERARLDKTVWADELLAQRHESTIVDLWDRLRGAADPEKTLAEYPFGELVLPKLGASLALGDGVTVRRGGEPERTVSEAEWGAIIDGWKQSGWRLAQSEWHHRSFVPRPDDARRSVVSAELHLRHTTGKRAMMRANLTVHWTPKPRGLLHRATRVEVRDLQVLERKGVVFEAVKRIKMGNDAPKPVLLYDLNDDGLSEILLPWSNLLYVNLGGGRYESRPLTGKRMHLVVAGTVADFTGDGYLDLVVQAKRAIGEPLHVYLITGSGGAKAFSGAPRKLFEPAGEMRTVRAFAVGDYDRDGDLDLYFGQYRGAYSRGRMPVPFDDADNSGPAYLLRNEGGGRFVDATGAAGLTKYRQRYTHSASFVDLDADGDLDLLTANDYAGVDLWLNDGGRFSLGNDRIDARHGFGMSHALSDFDADGRLDVFVTGMNSTTVRRLNQMGLKREDAADHVARRTAMTYGNRLLLGGADGRLTHAPHARDVAAAGWAWGSTAPDWNLDGRPDLFVVNGFMSRKTAKDYCTRYWSQDVYFDNSMEPGAADLALSMLVDEFESGVSWNGFEHNRLFTGGADGAFYEAGWLFGLGGEHDSRNALRDDIDGDGRPDLLVSEAHHGHLELRLMRNTLETKRAWIGAHLRGPNPFGARAVLTTSAGPRVATVVTGDSYVGQHAATVHFGLGDGAKVERLEVHWPDGRVSTLEAPQTGRYHAIGPP